MYMNWVHEPNVREKGFTGILFVHHASFRDFLQDQQRSSIFYINIENRMNVARACLKAMSAENQRLADDFTWRFGAYFIQATNSFPLSAELIPLIRRVNPEILWFWPDFYGGFEDYLKEAITRLKASEHTPEDLIQRWEDYYFMVMWGRLFRATRSHQQGRSTRLLLSSPVLHLLHAKLAGSSFPLSPANCYQFVAQSPHFIRIFQASWLLESYLSKTAPSSDVGSIYQVRHLLDLSWDDITDALFALRSLVVYPDSAPSLTSDLAWGYLRLIQRIGTGHLPQRTWWYNFYPYHWGRLVRSSPHSNSKLQKELYEFVPPWDSFPSYHCPHDCLCPLDFYHVLQWLKADPDSPLELIERWQTYLAKSRDLCKPYNNMEDSESYFDSEITRWHHWQDASDAMDSNKLCPPDDEERVIRWWECISREDEEEKQSR
ncbi:hypothetical protein GGX14DRAFT_588673 [Mycena pura]|uniref:Uncharacterized protein n=1 Tax=Mycena pura TaxID=153505 RepID=A0AAD6UZ14_9AGAR|nr:hypothetical protein GGX14DRAFT_588673 [Mycena pura]